MVPASCLPVAAQGRRRLLAAGLGVLPLLLAGCGTTPGAPAARPAGVPVPMDADSLGIRVQALHLTAHGYILDLRYRVLDPARAAPLLNGKNKVYLVDAERHAKLGVPESPIIGGMRQTSRNGVVYTDRDYFILFVNPGRAVQPGDRLELAVADHRVPGLAVSGAEAR